jgi:hypothetical protein
MVSDVTISSQRVEQISKKAPGRGPGPLSQLTKWAVGKIGRVTEAETPTEGNSTMADWSIQYDEESQQLTVTFPNDPKQRSYAYTGVPPDIAKRFAADDDKGGFFNRYIRGFY